MQEMIDADRPGRILTSACQDAASATQRSGSRKYRTALRLDLKFVPALVNLCRPRSAREAGQGKEQGCYVRLSRSNRTMPPSNIRSVCCWCANATIRKPCPNCARQPSLTLTTRAMPMSTPSHSVPPVPRPRQRQFSRRRTNSILPTETFCWDSSRSSATAATSRRLYLMRRNWLRSNPGILRFLRWSMICDGAWGDSSVIA